MPETKYGKYFHSKELIRFANLGYDGMSMWSHDGELNAGVSFGYHCINNTAYVEKEPHTHHFHEILVFIGGNPLDIQDFGGEIHLCMGEEREVHKITYPTAVSIPPELPHCPLTVVRCDKPIILLEISQTPQYDYKVLKEEKKGKPSSKK